MNPIIILLKNLIYKPIFNLIVILLAITGGNLGLAIILLTIIIRLLLLKPSLHAMNMQKDMTDIQPKIKELQERYKDNPQKLGEETMKLFKTSGTNPLKGCKMMLIQIPIFIGLFYVIKDFSEKHVDKNDIYSFLYNFIHSGIDNIQHIFLGIDLLKPSFKLGISGIILTIITGILFWIQIKLTTLNKPTTPSIPSGGMPGMPNIPDISKIMNIMNYFMIIMMMIFVYTMPAGLGIYMITTTLFTVIQYSVMYRELLKVKFSILFKK